MSPVGFLVAGGILYLTGFVFVIAKERRRHEEWQVDLAIILLLVGAMTLFALGLGSQF